MFFSETLCQQPVADGTGEGDVHDPAKMDVPDFRTAEAEFPASEAMQMDGYVRPLRDFAFELSEDVHHPSFWMSQRDPSTQRTGSHRLEAVLEETKNRSRRLSISRSRGPDMNAAADTERGLGGVPLLNAVFCADCETISNSPHDACTICGSHSLINLFRMLGGTLRSQKRSPPEAKRNLPSTILN